MKSRAIIERSSLAVGLLSVGFFVADVTLQYASSRAAIREFDKAEAATVAKLPPKEAGGFPPLDKESDQRLLQDCGDTAFTSGGDPPRARFRLDQSLGTVTPNWMDCRDSVARRNWHSSNHGASGQLLPKAQPLAGGSRN